MVGLGASCTGRGPCRGPLGAETEGTPSWGPGLFVVLQGVSLTLTDPTGSCCVVAVVGQSRRTKSPASSGSGRRALARPAPCPMRSTHRSSLSGRRASPGGARFSLTPTFFVYVPAGTSWVISKALLRGLETPFLRPLPLPLPLFGGDVLPMAKSTVVSTVR